jgi:hypothetical protein
MAWFYNSILSCFSKIGLVIFTQHQHSPPAGYVPKFASFLGISQISKFAHLANRQKPHFSMDGSFPKFCSVFEAEKRQFGWF